MDIRPPYIQSNVPYASVCDGPYDKPRESTTMHIAQKISIDVLRMFCADEDSKTHGSRLTRFMKNILGCLRDLIF